MADIFSTLLSDLPVLFSQIVKESTSDDSGWVPAGASLRSKKYAEWTEEDYRNARADSWHVCKHNEYAIGGLKARRNYCLRKGFTYDVEPIKGIEAATIDKDILTPTRNFLNDFLELNSWHEREVETLLRCDRDGEAIIRLFPSDGVPEVRFLQSEQLASPPDADDTTIRHGVELDPNDAEKRVAYWYDYGDGLEPIPESEIVHIRFNADSTETRGTPTYFPVIENLQRCEDLLKSMSTTTKARSKIAVLWKLAQMSAATETNLRSRLTEKTQTDSAGNRTPVNVEQMPFGSILRIRQGDDVEFPGANLDVAGQVENLQAELRSIACCLQMTEWMFTQLADQKYSNAFVVEAPTLREFETIQGVLKFALAEGRLGRRASVMWRALRLGVKAGLVPEAALRLCRISCTVPTLEVRDRAQEASVNQTYVSIGVKSIPTVQRELGLDPETEAKQGAEPFLKVTGASTPAATGNPTPLAGV